MANADTPMGLRPIRHRNGAPYTGAANPYHISNATNNTLFIGDMVLITGTSNTTAISVPGAGTFAVGTLPTILRVASPADGQRCSGVIVAFAADPTALENQYRLDSTERVAYVCDDPDVVFEIQGDSATVAAPTDVGAAAPYVQTHQGSTTTGLSGMELDVSELGTNPQDLLLVMRLVNRKDNETEAIHAKYEVVISNHTLNPEGAETNDGLLPI